MELFRTSLFAILITISGALNLILFASLSEIFLIQILLGLIGLSLDMTKALALLGEGSKPRRAYPRFAVASLFMLVSIIASTTVINAGLSTATQQQHRTSHSEDIREEQITLYAAQVATLTRNLDELPAEWPRNREMLLGQIAETQDTLDRLLQEQRGLSENEAQLVATANSGAFLFQLAELLGVPSATATIGFAFIVALLIETGIAYTASQTAQNLSSKAKPSIESSMPTKRSEKPRVSSSSPLVKYALGAFPAQPQQPLKGLETVAKEQGISMYWVRSAHAKLKDEGLITVSGRRSVATVGRDKAAEIASSIAV